MRLFLCIVGLAFALHAQRLAIVGANVIDGTGAPPRPATVIVSDGIIEAVGETLKPDAGTRILDAKGLTLLAGLFDVHTHLLASAGSVRADWGKNLKAYLLSGVTTVVDLSTYPEQFEPMRRLLAQGLAGPRVLMAARLSTPGGHGAEAGRGEFHTHQVRSPDEARAAIRELLPYKPDVFKVFTDGWRYGLGSDMTSMDEDTLRALVEEAHKGGVKVVTHTVSLDKAKVAARAGVDIIIHGIGDSAFDDEAIELMKKRGVGYAPTMAVYEPRAGRDISSPLLQRVLEPALREELKPSAPTVSSGPREARWRNLIANTAKLKAAGLSHAVGTDAGMGGTYHGWSTIHELELLVKAGLTPMEAIRAATATASRMLGVDTQRGTVTEGKVADLVLVEGSPAERISDMHRVRHVILGGKQIELDTLVREIATPDQTPLAARRANELLDDFEAERSRIDTLWIDNTDSGTDHSQVTFQRTKRTDGSYALTMMCKASTKKAPLCSMVLPLAKGSMEPVDATEFSGVEFETRGEGPYKLQMTTRARGRNYHRADFSAEPGWKKVRIPFSPLEPVDLLNLEFQMNRTGWLELDNVRFYR